MKEYTFKLIIREGCDEFWESLEGKPGCDEVLEAVKMSLDAQGWLDDDNQLTLEKFEDVKED